MKKLLIIKLQNQLIILQEKRLNHYLGKAQLLPISLLRILCAIDTLKTQLQILQKAD